MSEVATEDETSDAGVVICSCCGKAVAQSDVELAYKYPDVYHALDTAARSAPDTFCESNFCVVAGRGLFMRGLIPFPLDGGDEYCIGAWVELTEHDWRMARAMWNESGNDRIPEFDGRLANHVPLAHEISTLELDVRVQLHDDRRPTFRFVDTGHPLEDEQRQGISAHRALALSELAGALE